jgi:Transposase DDE domain
MDMSFDTFLIGLYLIVTDWLQQDGQRYIRPQGGAPPACSDGELLTLILAHQLSQATWHERRWLTWLDKNGYHAWFPQLPTPSAYNRRARHLAGVVRAFRVYLAQAVLEPLPTEAVVDGTPIHVRHWRRHGKHHLALPDADLGYCAAKREYFYGYRLVALVTRRGMIIDWVLLPASADERDGLDSLVADEEQWRIWGDKGFLDAARQAAWAEEQQVEVVTPRRRNQKTQLSRAEQRELGKIRPIVETAFAQAKEYVDLEHPRVKTFSGLAARLSAKLTALMVIAWANVRRGVSPLSYVNFAW